MAGSDAPSWKQLFDAADRTFGTRVNEFTRSENFAILAGLVGRAGSDLGTRSERFSRQLLHLVNLPAGSDVNRLLAQIGRLEREVRELRKQLDALGPPAGAAAAGTGPVTALPKRRRESPARPRGTGRSVR
jgi:hypothetical protein